MNKNNLFSSVSNDELHELFQEYRKVDDNKCPECFDKYILEYQSRNNFEYGKEEAQNAITTMFLEEFCSRAYPDTGLRYYTPTLECRGIEIESGDLVTGTAYFENDDDIRIIPQLFTQDDILTNTSLLRIRKDTLSYAIGRDDCNGKAIFIGDIIEYGYMENPYVIRFDPGTYSIVAEDPRTGDVQPMGDEQRPSLKIIGNIYQNPEKVGWPCMK